MAEFSKAFDFTAGWEGPWDGDKKGKPPLKLLKIDDYTASYGITPQYLKDFMGIAATLEYMRAIDRDKAAELWRTSRWAWYKLNDVASQDIATVLFDWAVRRPKMWILGVAAVLNISALDPRYFTVIKFVTYGGTPKDKNDGFYYPTFALIDLINNTCRNDAGCYDVKKIGSLYVKLMQQRIKSETFAADELGVVYRLASLLFNQLNLDVDSFKKVPTRNRDKMVRAVLKARQGTPLIQADLTLSNTLAKETHANQDADFGTLFLKWAALYVGGKALKIW